MSRQQTTFKHTRSILPSPLKPDRRDSAESLGSSCQSERGGFAGGNRCILLILMAVTREVRMFCRIAFMLLVANLSTLCLADANDVDEEIIVEATRQKPDEPITMERLRNANGRGAQLYSRGAYEDAFPYLLTAAQSGFKVAQARVSFLYQQGLGVERNAQAAIGWIGVAASSTTHPSIRDRYDELLERIPDDLMPQVEAIVAVYVSRYGAEATGVRCDTDRMAHSHISRLKCDFKGEFSLRNVVDREDIDSALEAAASGSAALGLGGSGIGVR